MADDDTPATGGSGRLYVVLYAAERTLDAADVAALGDTFALDERTLLIRSTQSRSRVYHAIKRRARPTRLFVGALADAPKFKGMNAGALKWLRGR